MVDAWRRLSYTPTRRDYLPSALNWSLLKCLEYLENKSLNLGTSDKELIQDEFKSHVHSLMNHQSVSKSAQKKTTRLFNDVDQLFESEEFLKEWTRRRLKKVKKQLLAVKKSLFDTEVQLTVGLQNTNCIVFGAENSGEASKRKREIEDDQMVADQNEKSLQALFGAELQCSENMMLICQHHNELCSNEFYKTTSFKRSGTIS
ncbi:hypothetical protein C1645_730850 [Glomus cerebriforme]|uniref:Uncharacterized protein n=1 Tax=Glomus cerebriforme TaxID=658196 RepID=A0A397TMF2_9GLOM|nr:hypothetical protein C1645_730850 [Glomus cerebriforme]